MDRGYSSTCEGSWADKHEAASKIDWDAMPDANMGTLERLMVHSVMGCREYGWMFRAAPIGATTLRTLARSQARCAQSTFGSLVICVRVWDKHD